MDRLLSRRGFLQACGGCALAAGAGSGTALAAPEGRPEPVMGGIYQVPEARFYEKIGEGRIRCTLCPNKCEVGDQERGYCGVRENRGGRYVTLVYGNPCALNLDPIEKKPLFHLLPRSYAYSLATAGCNVECLFCQNWEISQVRPEQTRNYNLPPEALVADAVRPRTSFFARTPVRAQSIAFTYSEPVVYYEYMYDTAVEARKRGIESVMISNGYITPEPLEKLCDVLSAVKIDLKAYTDDFYRKLVHGQLKPVLDTLKTLAKRKVWFEIVYLVIPTHNDDAKTVGEMAKWIHGELGPDVPVHFTAYFPTYKLRNLSRTPPSTLDRLYDVSRKAGLHYAYVGNVSRAGGHPGESTYCPKCSRRVVKRIRYRVVDVRIKDGKCQHCGGPVAGLWDGLVSKRGT
ncbi:AmmeMemoRadiSam system radical SAM enzyme [bacterium]|nr:AmmeMemoRadiSam system radical SAM enzyme [bacterium]